MLKNTWTQEKKKELPDIPARVGLQLMGLKDEKQPIRKVVEYVEFDFEYGKRLELTSFFQLFEEDQGDDFLVTDLCGFWSMFEDLFNRPFSTMVAEISNKSKLKTHTSTRKNVHLYFSNPAKLQHLRRNIS